MPGSRILGYVFKERSFVDRQSLGLKPHLVVDYFGTKCVVTKVDVEKNQVHLSETKEVRDGRAVCKPGTEIVISTNTYDNHLSEGNIKPLEMVLTVDLNKLL